MKTLPDAAVDFASNVTLEPLGMGIAVLLACGLAVSVYLVHRRQSG
jgi:hypothetical protein